MLDCAKIRRVEHDQDGHDLTGRHPPLSSPFPRTAFDLPGTLKRLEALAKVVHIAKHFGPIHRYPLHLGLLARTKGGEDTFLVQFTSTAVS